MCVPKRRRLSPSRRRKPPFCNTETEDHRETRTLTGRCRKPYAILCRNIAMARYRNTLPPKRTGIAFTGTSHCSRVQERLIDATSEFRHDRHFAAFDQNSYSSKHFTPFICTFFQLLRMPPLTIDRTEAPVSLPSTTTEELPRRLTIPYL